MIRLPRVLPSASVVLFPFVLSACGGSTSSSVVPNGYPSPDIEYAHAYVAPYDAVFDRIGIAIRRVGWKVVSVDRRDGIYVADTPVTLWTWGDSVRIAARKQPDGNVRVDVLSRTGQLIDWGKNQDNVKTFYAALDRELPTLVRALSGGVVPAPGASLESSPPSAPVAPASPALSASTGVTLAARDVVVLFFDALANNDDARMGKLLSADKKTRFFETAHWEEWKQTWRRCTVKDIGTSKVENHRAFVPVVYDCGGRELRDSVKVEEVNGAWFWDEM